MNNLPLISEITINKELAFEYNPALFMNHNHLTIKIQIGDILYDALVDTGSTISLIDESLINKDMIESVIGDVYCCTTKIFKIIGKLYNKKFTYDKQEYVLNFHVVSALDRTQYNIILGTDFLNSYGMIIDFKAGKLYN
jgi:predicted aspartyl protease